MRTRNIISPVLVSACLLGINCRYDGGNSLDEELVADACTNKYIPMCPESIGGMSTPRTPCQITNGDGFIVLEGKARVIGENKVDYTSQFIKGAREVAYICNLLEIKMAVLKDKSPSCGSQYIYKNNVLCKGVGITAACLYRLGIEIHAR